MLFRYNWERHWANPAEFNKGTPGICLDVARWVAEDVKAGVVAGDTWPATDPGPYPDEPACAFCVHNYLQTRHGIVTQENLALTQLADDKAYVFAYHLLAIPDPRRNRIAWLADCGEVGHRGRAGGEPTPRLASGRSERCLRIRLRELQ